MVKPKTVEVWRLETDSGVGVYAAGGAPCFRPDHPHPSLLSSEEEDLQKQFIGGQSDFYFGFKDLEQLKSWFLPSDLDRAHALGIKARRFRVEKRKVLFGRYQVAFDKQGAELIETLRPTEL